MSILKLMEDLFLLPFRLLLKILMLFTPVLIVLLAAIAAINYTYCTMSYLLGFLTYPIVLKRMGLSSSTSITGLDELFLCRNELLTLRNIKDQELDVFKDKLKREEKEIINEIQMIQKDTLQLDDLYTSTLQKKPDKIILVDPRSVPLIDRIRYNLFFLGG